MRFLLISHSYPPDPGAASSRTETIAKALLKKGHNVTVIAGRPYYPEGKVPKNYQHRYKVEEERDGISTIRVWIPALPTKGNLRRLLIYIAFMFSYDLPCYSAFDWVYYISPYPMAIFSWPAIIGAKLAGVKIMLDQHDLWPEIVTDVGGITFPGSMTLLKLMARISSWGADRITTDFDSIENGLIGLGVQKEKMRRVPLCVDTDEIRPGGEDNGKIVYAGILAKRYDFKTIIKAAKILPSLKFAILGGGEMVSDIRDMVEGVPNVEFREGFLSRAEYLKEIQSASVLVCPVIDSIETRTTIPTKVLDYIAVGKPVISSENPDVRQTGIVTIPFGDAQLMASMIMFNQIGNGEINRKTCVEKYSLDVLGTSLENAIA